MLRKSFVYAMNNSNVRVHFNMREDLNSHLTALQLLVVDAASINVVSRDTVLLEKLYLEARPIAGAHNILTHEKIKIQINPTSMPFIK